MCNTTLSSKRCLNNHIVFCQHRMKQLGMKPCSRTRQNNVKRLQSGHSSLERSSRSNLCSCIICDKSFAALRSHVMHHSALHQSRGHASCQEFCSHKDFSHHAGNYPSGSKDLYHNSDHGKLNQYGLAHGVAPSFKVSDEHSIGTKEIQASSHFLSLPFDVGPIIQPSWTASQDECTDIPVSTEVEMNRDASNMEELLDFPVTPNVITGQNNCQYISTLHNKLQCMCIG